MAKRALLDWQSRQPPPSGHLAFNVTQQWWVLLTLWDARCVGCWLTARSSCCVFYSEAPVWEVFPPSCESYTSLHAKASDPVRGDVANEIPQVIVHPQLDVKTNRHKEQEVFWLRCLCLSLCISDIFLSLLCAENPKQMHFKSPLINICLILTLSRVIWYYSCS